MKLLIADDNPAMRDLLRQLFAGIATDVRVCGTGTEAVALFETFQPEWTLMDFIMPGMDGLVATTTIKSAHPDARIVIITQQRGREYQEAAMSAGAFAFVPKEDLHSLPRLLTNAFAES